LSHNRLHTDGVKRNTAANTPGDLRNGAREPSKCGKDHDGKEGHHTQRLQHEARQVAHGSRRSLTRILDEGYSLSLSLSLANKADPSTNIYRTCRSIYSHLLTSLIHNMWVTTTHDEFWVLMGLVWCAGEDEPSVLTLDPTR